MCQEGGKPKMAENAESGSGTGYTPGTSIHSEIHTEIFTIGAKIIAKSY
jgi:hypothetical protein